MLIPGAKGIVSNLALSGDAPIPGSGAVVGWDFAKVYADMNLGFTSDYTVSPTASIGVDVFAVSTTGVETLLASSASNAISFAMPNSRIRIRPRASLDLSLAPSLGFGMQGDIGVSPIALRLDGSIGSGSRAETYHVNVDPAHFSWVSDPKGLARVKNATLSLGHTDQTFDGLYLALANLNDLPPRIYPGSTTGTGTTGDAPLEINAYSLDPDTENDPRFTVRLAPEQGYTYLYNSPRSRIDAEVVPAATGGPEAFFDPTSSQIQGAQAIRMQFRSSDLKPGRYTLHTTVEGTNSTGAFKHAEYRTPFNVNFAQGILDGEFYRDGDPANAINRSVADGTDKTIQVDPVDARHLYRETEVVMNGTVVLPSHSVVNDPDLINSGQQLQFTVPAAVAKRFAGTPSTIQLRTRDLSGDGTACKLSAPKPLFIVAGAPTIIGTQFQDVANKVLPLAADELTFEVDGANFNEATKVNAVWTRDGVAKTTPLATAYASPSALRVTVSADFMADFHSHSSDGQFRVQATTAIVPADLFSPQVTSGGTSAAFGVKLIHIKPTITRFEPRILIRDSGAQTIKVYGDGLLRDPSGFYAQDFRNGFGPGASVSYPSGTGLAVPYLLVSLPANYPALGRTGQTPFVVDYRDVRSDSNMIATENGKPVISTGTLYQAVMTSTGADLTLQGGPVYGSDTSLYVNGTRVPSVANSTTSITARLLASLTGTTASITLTNPAPGGGDPNAISVALLEGDPNTVTVSASSLVYDRTANTYRQSFKLGYKGTHDVSAGVRLVFGNVPSDVTLLNASGVVIGKPYLSTPLMSSQSVAVVATWRRTGNNPVDSSNTVAFPY